MYRKEYGSHKQVKTGRLETKRTDSPWPLSCAALITTKRLFAILQYLEKSAAYSDTGREFLSDAPFSNGHMEKQEMEWNGNWKRKMEMEIGNGNESRYAHETRIALLGNRKHINSLST